MTEVLVEVSVEGRQLLAGTLYSHRRRDAGSFTFAYTAPCLATQGSYALDPELELRTGSHQTSLGRASFGASTDCSPDRWGRTLLIRREAALARSESRPRRSLGEVDFLLGVRDDLRQGALRFRVGDGPHLADGDTGVPALTDLPSLLDLAARAEDDSADLTDLQRLIRAGSSLGGARPKAHVPNSDGRISIAKFPSADHDTWNVMAWEKVALDLAHQAGIDVPTSRLLHLAGRNVLVVSRFDRTDTGARIGYVSAMTMLGASDGDQRGYLEIAEIIESTSARPTDDLRQLWRRIVFSVLISNTDDHLRNHGVLHGGGGVWHLSPAFDLIPNPGPGPKYLTTAIDTGDDTASVAAALAVAGYFRLSDAQARATLSHVAAAVNDWRIVAGRHNLTPRAIKAMEPAFAALAGVDEF